LAVSIYIKYQSGSFKKGLLLKRSDLESSNFHTGNIAEGDELNTNKQSVNFFYIAKGSAAELLNQAIIAHEIGYIPRQQLNY
jgi:four helix bundle protein